MMIASTKKSGTLEENIIISIAAKSYMKRLR